MLHEDEGCASAARAVPLSQAIAKAPPTTPTASFIERVRCVQSLSLSLSHEMVGWGGGVASASLGSVTTTSNIEE